jgi:hypothetical protein
MLLYQNISSNKDACQLMRMSVGFKNWFGDCGKVFYRSLFYSIIITSNSPSPLPLDCLASSPPQEKLRCSCMHPADNFR